MTLPFSNPHFRQPKYERPCNPKERRFRCLDCGKVFSSERGCEKRSCPRCEDDVKRIRKRAVVDHMGDVDAPWWVWVLTLPEQLWPIITNDQINQLRRQGVNLIHDLYRDLVRIPWRGRASWLVGCFEATHPVGDVNPERFQPHFNYVGPLLLMNRREKAVKRLPLWIPPEHLERLRHGWRDQINSVMGTAFEEVDVHYEYRTANKKKWHCARYFARPFPEWHHEGVNRVRWYGWLASRVAKNAKALLEEKGFLRVGLMMEGMDDQPKGGEGDGPPCPDCGGPSELMTWATADGRKILRDHTRKRKTA